MIKHSNWNEKQKQACSGKPYEWQKVLWVNLRERLQEANRNLVSSIYILSRVPIFPHDLPCMAVVEFPKSLEKACVTMWNCRFNSWAWEHDACHQILTWRGAPGWLRAGTWSSMWNALSCLAEEVIQREEDRCSTPVRKGDLWRKQQQGVAVTWEVILIQWWEAFTCSVTWEGT